MGRKIFVSYKHNDNDVKHLASNYYTITTAADYVNYLENNIFKQHIYKGEKQGEDLSNYSESFIWNHLKDKLFDSTLTLVLISPNMKESYRRQRDQWIPWEISYSLRKTTRGGKTSQRNSILAVILPDKYGNYDYFNQSNTFPILRDNINTGYIHITEWHNFLLYPDAYFRIADAAKEMVMENSICIEVQ
ncbi:MAG: TIR domain-containing protein [Clostridia bacterium]|nr:TIR domain-containing protein [Clostridia bacterium]